MSNTNSLLIANAIASPRILTDVGLSGGRERVMMGTIEIAAADFDADGDTIRLAKIPTHARIVSIEIGNDDLDTSTNSEYHLGLAKEDGTIKDENAYADAVSLQAAAVLTRVENEIRDISKVGQQIWQDAGDTTDPNLIYEIVMYQTTASASAQLGTVSFIIKYTID